MAAVIDDCRRLDDISAVALQSFMSSEVLTAYEGWSIKRLAGFFVKHNISGAPVVAADHTLVGVVTQADVIRFESESVSDYQIERAVQFYYGPNVDTLTDADIKHLKERANETCTVNTIMTPKVVSMDIGTPAGDACARMVEENLQRLFVTEQGRVVGVVTAMDFLRRMAAGKQEATAS